MANVPILLADLLLSSETQPNHRVALPTVGDLPTPSPLTRTAYPSGLMQKLFVLNDHAMVAWSGTYIAAVTVLKELKEKFSQQPINGPSVKKFFNEFGAENLKGLQFIGVFRDGNGVSTFGYDTYNFTHEHFGECHIGGSGAGRLIQKLYSERTHEVAGGTLRDVDHAVTYALTTASEFIGEELLTNASLEQHFGGGFEVGTVTTNGAEKVGDILHIFWVWNENENEDPKLLPTIIKSDYLDQNLIIQRIHQVQDKQSSQWLLDDHLVSVVLPPTTSIRDTLLKPPPPDLNCRFLCCYHFRTSEARLVTATTTLYQSGTKQGPVKFNDTENQIRIHFDLDHFKKEFEIVKDVLSTDRQNTSA